jgi:hypothetical protein
MHFWHRSQNPLLWVSKFPSVGLKIPCIRSQKSPSWVSKIPRSQFHGGFDQLPIGRYAKVMVPTSTLASAGILSPALIAEEIEQPELIDGKVVCALLK